MKYITLQKKKKLKETTINEINYRERRKVGES